MQNDDNTRDFTILAAGTSISHYVIVEKIRAGGPAAPCFEEGDIDGNGSQDISDLTYYVDFMFNTGPEPPDCP